MKRKIYLVGLIILMLSTYTTALQDTNLTMSNGKGLCLYFTDVDCQLCDNATFTLSGTQDHVMGLANERPFGNCNNKTLNSTQLINTYMADGDMVTEYVIAGLLFTIFLSWVFRRKESSGGIYR